MRHEIAQLRRLAVLNYNRGLNTVGSRDASRGYFPAVNRGGAGRGDTNTAGLNTIEIHIVSDGRLRTTGTGVSGGPGVLNRERSGIPWGNSGSDRYRIGNPGRAEVIAPAIDIGDNTAVGSRGFGNRGVYTAGLRGVRSNGAGVIENVGGGGGATRGIGGGSRASAVIGVAGLGVSTDGSSLAQPGGTRSLGNGARGSVTGGVVGVGGIISSGGTGDNNNVNVGVGTVRASYTGGRSSGASGSGGATNPFSSALLHSPDDSMRNGNEMNLDGDF